MTAREKRKDYKESYSAAGMRLSQVLSENLSDDEDEVDINGLDAAESKFPEIALPEDTYGMILIAEGWTSPMIFSVVCICFQLVLVTLIVMSLVKKSNTKNPFNVPIGVDAQVIGAQALAVPLAAFSAEDLLTALSFLFICVDDHVRQAIPEVTKTRWLLAFGSKAVEGLLCLTTIFLLVVQSDTVTGLCLNFAALSFVWNIDDMFYTLGRCGYFSTQIRRCADRLSATRIPLIHQKRLTYARNYSFYLFMAVMFSLWLWVAISQLSGKFLCNRLLVQFDDVQDSNLAKLSGLYHRRGHNKNYYAIYEGPKSSTSQVTPVIEYCSSLNVWTLHQEKKNTDACDWVAKSPVSYDHNIMSTSEGWFANVKTNYEHKAVGALPFVHMSIECLDCDYDAEPIRDNCADRGTCGKDGRCTCKEGFYGFSCEFAKPCDKLVTHDRRGAYSVINGTLVFDNSYQLMKNEQGDKIIEAQNRPVYYQNAGELLFAIFFDGYRWRLVKMRDEGLKKARDTFANYNPYIKNYDVIQFSDPMKTSSPGDRFVPAFLDWYKPVGNEKVDMISQTVGSLVCEGCSDLQQCRHNGECKSGRCICKKCSEGNLCEIISDTPECNETESVDFF